jgi:hypothetical protein
MAYNPSSSVLFITLGSKTQLSGGETEYNEHDSITSRLPLGTSRFLLRLRSEAFTWLKGDGTAKWEGIVVSELKNNKALMQGRDFNSHAKEARYFPALRRFTGKLFKTLGRDGQISLYQSQHHTLFLCALYGLMTPMEPIQMYNCPLETEWPVFRIWTETDSLTNILLAYIRKNKIGRVFDLTATETRRRLVSWPAIHLELEDNVLHCFASTGAGDNALMPFGEVMKDFLLKASTKELMNIQSESEIGDVVFRETTQPRRDMPRETELEFGNQADEIERRRRGVIRFLDKTEQRRGDRDESVSSRIGRLTREHKIGLDEAKAMRVITRLRNVVVYEEHQLNQKEADQAEISAKLLADRARKRGWMITEF